MTGLVSSPVLWQIARFGVTGLALTILMSGLYLGFEKWVDLAPGLAVILATVVATIVGYFAHSKFSFRGFGARDRPDIRFGRFLATNAVGLSLNYLFVRLLVDALAWPIWAPIPLFVIVTPAATFLLNRKWVFRR